jgi:hypothetical protein
MKYNINKLREKRLSELTDEEILVVAWKEKGIEFVIDDYYNGELPNLDMSFKEFLTHCTACGGNWGSMLLSGIQELLPQIWEEIPIKLGSDGFMAFTALNIFLRMLGVYGNREFKV